MDSVMCVVCVWPWGWGGGKYQSEIVDMAKYGHIISATTKHQDNFLNLSLLLGPQDLRERFIIGEKPQRSWSKQS
jgi:hypothetical protein